MGFAKNLMICVFYSSFAKLNELPLLHPKFHFTKMTLKSYLKLLKREMKMQSHGSVISLFWQDFSFLKWSLFHGQKNQEGEETHFN